MKVNITIPKARKGKFSEIKLGYKNEENEDIQVLLNVDFQNLYEFTRKKNGIGFDVFLIGCFVYGIDILLPRKSFSVNGWSREIEVEFPVESLDLFNGGKNELEQLLSFLTGDYWQISFIQRDVTPLFVNTKKVYSNDYRKSHKRISLFSGGLDSLIGVIDQLAKSKDRMVLVSHYDATFKGAKSDQDKIDKILYKKYSHYHLLQTRVDLEGYDINGNKINTETTLRSRSFLFLCQAVFVASSIEDGIEILIPENGTISLNHPLTPSRRSSCSTRTAHPYYLIKVIDFISKLGLNHLIKNEYEMKTKGEMLEECIDNDILRATYKKSCSCAKRGTRKDIRDVMTGTNHCGICMPCIYRRVALHRIGVDDEVVGTNLFNPQKYPLEKLPDVPAFLDYMRNPLSIEDIEKNLLINGTLPLNKVEQYASVVFRTRSQIIDWIRDKGSVEIKKKLGIQ
ncbi:Qat anti-phage system QueC-like protein QatC [Tannerella forsythia]|uniref:Qat anti-phage system QueC-like protein QatC n=1 Tax=Tannerella forsythia TaxID=28112 RepID=UPI0028E39F07|nr:Qat anti-phage system QueC-like protein QatC [Tannerella forsythia]